MHKPDFSDRKRFPYISPDPAPMPTSRIPPRPRLGQDEFYRALFAAVYAEVAREDATCFPNYSPEAQEKARRRDDAEARALCSWLYSPIGIRDMDSLLQRSYGHDPKLTRNLWDQVCSGRLTNDGRVHASRAVGALRKSYDDAVSEAQREWDRECEARRRRWREGACEDIHDPPTAAGSFVTVPFLAPPVVQPRSSGSTLSSPFGAVQRDGIVFVGHTPGPQESTDEFLFFGLPGRLAQPRGQ